MSVHFGEAPFRSYEGYHFGDEKVHGHDPEGTTSRTKLEEHSESSEKQFGQPEAFKPACDIECGSPVIWHPETRPKTPRHMF